ncbi:MAG: hypothetical protein Q7S23_02980 [bacterium]|nr:hypothetical protein [bacterium]
MIGKPLRGEDWNQRLDTVNGYQIARWLAPFHAAPLVLRPPLPGFQVKFSELLAGIGVQATAITALSMHQHQRIVDQIEPLSVGSDLRQAYAAAIRQRQSSPIGNYLRSSLRDRQFVPNLWGVLQDSIGVHLPECLGPAIASLPFAVADTLWTALYCQINLLLCAQYAAMAMVTEWTDKFLAGNHPAGLMDDGTFVVVVA